MAKRLLLTILVMVVCVISGQSSVYSTPVNGYNSYIALLPGGKAKQINNFEIIQQAQSEVVVIESEKKGRTIRFNRPIDIYTLNKKYIMVAFDISYKPESNSRYSSNAAVVGLLFVSAGDSGLKRYTKNYLKWIGQEDVDQYKNSNIGEYCGFFRQMGVDDCVPDGPAIVKKSPQAKPVSAKKQKKQKKSVSVDPTIVRKKEFTRAIENSDNKFSVIDTEISRQNNEISRQNEVIEALTERLEAMDQALIKAASAPGPKAEKPSDTGPLLSRIDTLETELSKKNKHVQALESRVKELSLLLNGVSRSKNDITFSGLNLRIVNGSGKTTGKENGTGNLIIGYNEKKPGEKLKAGSHQIISPEQKEVTRIVSKPVPSSKEDEVQTSGLCFIGTTSDNNTE